MISELLTAAPATLNRVTEPPPPVEGKSRPSGLTPLCVAARHGKIDAVRLLLSAGAVEPKSSLDRSVEHPIRAAVQRRHEEVLRVLLSAKGLTAISGDSLAEWFPFCIVSALCRQRWDGLRNARMLHMMLSVEGEKRRSYWARCTFAWQPVLFSAIVNGSLLAMSVLLSAGADVIVAEGFITSQAVDQCVKDGDIKAAAHRMLEQVPAFRARSWAWRQGTDDVTGSTAAAVVAVAGAIPAPLTAAQHGTLGVRMIPPRSGKLLVRIIAR